MKNVLRRAASCAAVMLAVAMSPPGSAVPVAQKEFDLVLKRTPDPKHGAKLYDTCAACHGERGEGAPDGSVPAIGGQPYTIVAKQLVDFRAGARGDERMAHFTGTRHLAYSQHIADVAAHIASLPPPVPAAGTATPDAVNASRLYTRHCERCHGSSAEGKEDFLAPRLAGQHAQYLLGELRDAAEGRRAPMEETHAALVKQLSESQLRTIATWLAAGAR